MNARAPTYVPESDAPSESATPPISAADWRTQAAVLIALQLANLFFESVRTEFIVFASVEDWIIQKLDETMRNLIIVVAVVAALQSIERLGPRSKRTPLAILAMATATLAGSAIAAFAFPYPPMSVSTGMSASTAVWFWYTLWMSTMRGLIALVILNNLRQRQQAIQELKLAQERGRAVRQQLASAQLLEIHARVDPQLLFDMLATVKRLYEQDAAKAEALLDDLTTFLRAALPRLHTAHSALEIEFGLVQCYVRLLRGAGAASVDLDIGLPEHLEGARFPAGVLLPLLGGATRRDRRIALEASAVKGVLRIRARDSSPPAAATLDRLRHSLSDLYGKRGLVQTQPRDGGAETVLEVPLEAS
jgi:hypothetical protein